MYVSSGAVKPPGLLNKFILSHLILSYHKHKGFLMVWLIGVAAVYFIVFKFLDNNRKTPKIQTDKHIKVIILKCDKCGFYIVE